MIEPTLFGALGNQMFGYAVARTVAEKKGYNFYIDKERWWDTEVFDLDYGMKDGDYRYTFKDTQEQAFNPKIFDVKDFTLLYGFFQSEKYFDHDKARKWFVPKEKIETTYDNHCFIHYRGLDYNEPFWECNRLPMSYYDEAMERVLSLNPHVTFIVITDDRKEAGNLFPNETVVSSSVAMDFALLNASKYVIVSNSSFSWWAAWLNPNNIVIAPEGWFNYNTNKKVFLPADIFVPRWIWI